MLNRLIVLAAELNIWQIVLKMKYSELRELKDITSTPTGIKSSICCSNESVKLVWVRTH